MRFSPGSGFLYINKHVCKQICPVWLQLGRKDWIHAPVALCGVGGGDIPPFCFGVPLFNPPFPPPRPRFFLLSWSSPIAFLPADSHVPIRMPDTLYILPTHRFNPYNKNAYSLRKEVSRPSRLFNQM